jgi:hypothetical protein
MIALQEVAPVSLPWPLVAGGVAAVVSTAALVGGIILRMWKRLDRRILEPLGELISDWRGDPGTATRPARPGIPARMATMERHLGNGADPPLRRVVEDATAELARVAAVAHRADQTSSAGLTLAQANAAQLAEHYVRGHGTP